MATVPAERSGSVAGDGAERKLSTSDPQPKAKESKKQQKKKAKADKPKKGSAIIPAAAPSPDTIAAPQRRPDPAAEQATKKTKRKSLLMLLRRDAAARDEIDAAPALTLEEKNKEKDEEEQEQEQEQEEQEQEKDEIDQPKPVKQEADKQDPSTSSPEGPPKEAEVAPPTVGEARLLSWCRKQTEGYAGVSIENFHSSWRDGLAFCALIHRFKPQAFDFAKLQPSDVEANLKLAFATAETELGIPAYLSSEDVADSEGAEIVTYLLKFRSVVVEDDEESPQQQEAAEDGENGGQAHTPSCVLLAERSSNQEPGAVLASLASSRPRLALPKKAQPIAQRRRPTRGVRPGDKITTKAVTENKRRSRDSTVYCLENMNDPAEEGQAATPEKQRRATAGASGSSKMVAGATPAKLRKGTAPPPLEKMSTSLHRGAATTEGDVEMPAWKLKLIEKKRQKAAAEAAAVGEVPESEKDARTAEEDEDEEPMEMMEGFLFKRDGDRWVRKWFVLNGPHLVYYGDRRTPKNQLKPQAILSLELISSVEPCAERDNAIEIKDEAQCVYQVYACTKAEYELWLDALQAAYDKHSLHLVRQSAGSTSQRSSAAMWSNIASAVKEGELLLLPNKGLGSFIGVRKWKKTYVVVKDGFLERSSTKGGKANLRMPLLKCEFTAYEDKYQKHAFRVSTAKKKLILAASEDSDMHDWMTALLKQRLYMERAMNSITASSSSPQQQQQPEDAASSMASSSGASNGDATTNNNRGRHTRKKTQEDVGPLRDSGSVALPSKPVAGGSQQPACASESPAENNTSPAQQAPGGSTLKASDKGKERASSKVE